MILQLHIKIKENNVQCQKGSLQLGQRVGAGPPWSPISATALTKVLFTPTVIGGSSELPKWLMDSFLVTFGSWRGQCTHTIISIHLLYTVINGHSNMQGRRGPN